MCVDRQAAVRPQPVLRVRRLDDVVRHHEDVPAQGDDGAHERLHHVGAEAMLPLAVQL